MIKNLSLLKILQGLSVWLISITVTSFLFYYYVNRAVSSNPEAVSSKSDLNLATPVVSPPVDKYKSILPPPRLIEDNQQNPSTNTQPPAAEATTKSTSDKPSTKTQSQTVSDKPALTKSNPTSSTSTNKPKTQSNSVKQQKPYTSPVKPQQQSTIPVAANYISPEIEIRVGVKIDVDSLYIGTSTQGYLTDKNGKVLHSLSPSEALRVSSNGDSLSIGDWQLPAVVWLQVNGDGLIYIDDNWYRGRLLLVARGSQVVAVNYVDLEHYLYSVVGSEMHPTANIEALKAQAIAARSYALVHIIRPASKLYNLGATQRWQVYKGITKEYNTTIQAVNETAGEILSYDGGVVESLYAANDEIVARVHRGRGMSQTGAYDLANQGYNYLEILQNYYPGVELAQLTLEQ